MLSIPVKKEFFASFPNSNTPSPTVNKYSETCQKRHMPESVKVVPKKNLLEAITISLKKGGDISKNEEILKLCETVKVSALNADNLCCISHRWCTSDVTIEDFVDNFIKFCRLSYVCSEDTCFEEKNLYHTYANWWEMLDKIVVHVFEKCEESVIDKFANYLKTKTTLTGFDENVELEESSLEEADSLDEVFSGLMVGMATLQIDINRFYTNVNLSHGHETIRRWLAFAIPSGILPNISEKDVGTMMTSFKKEGKNFTYSEPKKLLQEVTDLVRKVLNDWSKEKNISRKRFEEALQLCEDMKSLTNRGSGFNGHDPIALATLMMLRNSSFDYFWVDVFCTPQRKEDIQETLKAVKDGMAVFSIATVIISPPFSIERLLKHGKMSLVDLFNPSNTKVQDSANFIQHYKKLPFLTFNERCYLFADSSYFDRMWTLHEMAIGKTMFFWWQFLFGPFSKTSESGLTFRVDEMFHKNYRTGIDTSSFETTMSRSIAVSTLRQWGPGDGLSSLFGNNFSTMQSGFSLDWETLATSIFNLEPEKSVSDQLMIKKLSFYQSCLLQFSPQGRKYSYAWMKNLEHVNHTFRFDDNWQLMSGSVFNPDEHNPPKRKFTLDKGEGKLDGETILRNCKAYHVNALTIEGFFDPFTLQLLFHLIGPRKDELNKINAPGYVILADWKVPKIVVEARKKAADISKTHQAKEKNAQSRKSYQMMIDYLKPVQKVLFLKSSDPKKDFSVVFGIIPNQVTQVTSPNSAMTKSIGLKKVDNCKFDVI